jgi:tellurite methyltransferase
MGRNHEQWNERWQQKAQDPWVPDPWLVRVLNLLPPGRLLDVACGRGRNALFLAEQGHAVTALDIAAEGLQQLQAEAQRRGLQIETRQVDLDGLPDLGRENYEVVIDFFYLQRALMPAVRAAVAPGGVAVVRTFSRAGNFPGEGPHPDFVLDPGELLEIFSGWAVLLHEEGLEPSSKGGGLAGIVARKPRPG